MEAHAVALALEAEITSVAESQAVSTADIAALAYHLWQDRGCPMGSPEEDWYRAEELLTARAPDTGQ
jgi:nucleoside phosphorylase